MAKKVKAGLIYSRLKYAVFIDYDGKKMCIYPNSQGQKIADVSRCSNLPVGVFCVEAK